MADLTYRPITDLTDEEIVALLTTYCNTQSDYENTSETPLPDPELLSVVRDASNHQITAIFKAWVRDPDDGTVFDVEDVIDIDEYGEVSAGDFAFSESMVRDIHYRLMAYGCHPLLDGNPYLR